MILKELILKGSLQLFADDIAIVYQAENWTIIEDDINSDWGKIQIWMSSNNLAINAKKSDFIIFGNGEIPDLNIMFDFDNKIITSVQKVKYLGVRIDNIN
jgi:hypothetical protein